MTGLVLENKLPHTACVPLIPAPSHTPGMVRRFSDFACLIDSLEYAALGDSGVNFYSGRGELEGVHTYADIMSRAKDLALHLNALGVSRLGRVGIIADMSIDFIIAFFACQYAGLLAVPLPVVTGLGGRHGYEAQLERVIDTSGAQIILGPQETHDSLKKACNHKSVKFIGTLGQLAQMSASAVVLQPLGPEDPSHIQYSSGSTRNPLGVLISQKSLMANARSVAQHGLQFTEHDRVVSWLPFYHDMGLIGFLLIPVTSQLTIDLLQTDGFARRPLKWLEVISANRGTLSFSPTFGYEICTRRAIGKADLEIDLSSWRAAGIGGEMVQPSVMEQFCEAFGKYGFRAESFVPSYGLAEMTLAFSFSPLNTGVLVDTIDQRALNEDRKAVPVPPSTKTRSFALCGSAMPGYGVQIRGDHGDLLGEREIGQIFISGPAMMECYFEDAQATSAVMAGDGWMNTGDMGYMTNGMIVITGRQKDLIIINGRNIWPQDLEWHAEDEVETLRNRDTAAFSVEDADGSERAVMLAHCRTRDPALMEALRKEIQAAVFTHAGIDCRVVLIPPSSLPYTTSGKLSRARAKQEYLAGVLRDLADTETSS